MGDHRAGGFDGESRESEPLRLDDLFLNVGFSLMLGWHYLVLFSPVFEGSFGGVSSSYLADRQLALYLSLAASFAVLAAFRRLTASHPGFSSPGHVYAIGALSTVVSLAYAAAPVGMQSLPLVVALGFSEAALMVLWLARFMKVRAGHLLRPFGINMVWGGAIAIVVCFMQWPASPLMASLIPGVSAVLLARLPIAEESAQEPSEGDAEDLTSGGEFPIEDERRDSRGEWLMIVYVGIYAVSFGLLQGSFAAVDVALIMVDNAYALLGIIVAGVITYMIPDHFYLGVSADTLHRFSLMFFVLGTVCVAWYSLGELFLPVSQVAILAGFNLFDFGVLIYGVLGNSNLVFDRTRPVVYCCLAMGLLIGRIAIGFIPVDFSPSPLIVICGAAVVMLVSTTLIPLYGFELVLHQSDPDGDAISVEPSSDAGVPAFSGASLIAVPRQLAPVIQSVNAASGEWWSPWKTACWEIVELYKLSPREAEVFFLLAKGRNAEHVQQKLVISNHTAKTHIANIYRKLEVHSAQELLDLVEEFQDAQGRPSGEAPQ